MALLQSELSMANDNYFVQKQVEMMMDASNRKFAGEIANLNSTVAKLKEEIADLRLQVRATGVSSAARSEIKAEPLPVQSEPAKAVEEQKPMAGVSSPTTTSSGLPRPRYGDYKPEDVSINKFFYYGSKR